MEISSQKLRIKDLAAEDRPREKLLAKGISSLSNAELLGILIASGNREETAVDLSQRILSSVGNNLHELGKLSIAHLIKHFKGIGEAKAITIIAALELGRRRKIADVMQRKSIQNSNDAFEIFHSLISDLPHEEFWVMLLNQSNKVIDTLKISQGGVSATVTDIRIILRIALEKLATGIIVAHNHPSGNRKPSEADAALTHKLKKACEYMDIRMNDHIIVAGNGYFSFADEGLL